MLAHRHSECWGMSKTTVAQRAWLGGLPRDTETRGRDRCEDSSRTNAPAYLLQDTSTTAAPGSELCLNFALLCTSPPVAESSRVGRGQLVRRCCPAQCSPAPTVAMHRVYPTMQAGISRRKQFRHCDDCTIPMMASPHSWLAKAALCTL